MRFLVMLALLASALPAQATMYKWVDAQGKIHYSDTLPPQSLGRGNVELDKQGLAIKRNAGALSAEQRQQQAQAQARKTQENVALTERKRRDSALLNTYTSPAEIDLARDRNMEQARLIIKSNDARLTPLRATRAQLVQQIAGITRNQKLPPAHLTQARDANAAEIARLEQLQAQKNKEMDETRAKFDADKARYIELMQGARPQ
jgi:chorismate mutase